MHNTSGTSAAEEGDREIHPLYTAEDSRPKAHNL